jgi:hypothetical protein
MMPVLFDDPETLEGRLKYFSSQVADYLKQLFSAEQLKQDMLARQLARLAKAGLEAVSSDGVLRTIEQALALARAAMPATADA